MNGKPFEECLSYQIEIEGAHIDDKIKTPNCLEAGGDGNVC
jgi:hypothetical protein